MSLKSFVAKNLLNILSDDPDKAFHQVLSWVDRMTKDEGADSLSGQRNLFHQILSDPNSMWYKYMKDIWINIDSGVRTAFLENFIANATVIGRQRQEKTKAKHGCNVPWAILMDPTSACNIKCTGCWAAEYGNKLNMDLHTLDKIITEGKSLGTYMYIYSGGEPLVKKNDILTLCEKHPDCMFLAFTNGTLIDDEFTDGMLRVKNFIPAISIEGFKKENDDRRGEGVFDRVVAAMDLLKRKRLAFGASLCYTSKNTDVIGSDEFFDFLIEKGALFAWLFTYMPIGTTAPTDLIAKPEQREFMYHKIREFRSTKPIFTMDFWNDGEYVNGCIAGGRYYIHINANGDIEPCAFIHYSDTNIHENSLLDAYKRPLFTQYKENQPFNENLNRPCPLLDNPEKLSSMVHISGAHSTDLKAPEDVDSLCGKCENPAAAWAPVADQLWDERNATRATYLKNGN